MMDKWLPTLSTNRFIYFEGGEDFFMKEENTILHCKEGIKMSCEISEVNEKPLIEIHARHSFCVRF